jgi:ornithine carbamoyltransferase
MNSYLQVHHPDKLLASFAGTFHREHTESLKKSSLGYVGDKNSIQTIFRLLIGCDNRNLVLIKM